MPPLREGELREVVSRPAQLLAARFESEGLIDIISRRTARIRSRTWALCRSCPTRSTICGRKWCVETTGRCAFRRNPSSLAACSSTVPTRFWRRIQGPKLPCGASHFAVCDVREDGEPTRRRAARAEFSDEEWRLVGELADYPNRLVVIATTETGETYAEVAHEAIFRRWDKLREWVSAEREFLAWRSGLEAARRAWQATADASKHDALLMGAALTQAQSWLAKRPEDLPRPDRKFIALSMAREKAEARARRLRALVYVLLIFVISGLVAWINQSISRSR